VKDLARYLRWAIALGVALLVAVVGVIVTRHFQPAPVEGPQAPPPVQVDAQGPAIPGMDLDFNGSGVALVAGGVGGAVALDGEGRLVVMGRSTASRVPRVALWRFTAAGRLDSTFGAQGAAVVPNALPGAGSPDTGEFGQALAIDAKDRIVIAGYGLDKEGSLHMALWRFTPGGTADPAFHGTGVVTATGSAGAGADDSGKGVAIDARGRIVVAGSSWTVSEDGSARESLALWRFTDAGERDRAFHGSGALTVPDTRGNGVAVDPSGRILVAGATFGPRSQWVLAVWRFLPDGSADGNWNDGEVVTVSLPERDWLATSASGVLVARDGRVVVLGSIYDRRRLSDVNDSGIQTAGVWRFKPDGTPDAAFNQSRFGLVAVAGTAGGSGEKAGDHGRAFAIDSLGRIVVAGASRDRRGVPLLAVWRRTEGGAPDAALGRDGAIVQRNPPEQVDDPPNALVNGVAVDALGRIVMTGGVRLGDKAHLALWRLKP
jgi:uncharacterized delta-60 repeat protein